MVDQEYSDEVIAKIEEVYALIEKEKLQAFDKNRDYIDRALRREIVSKLWGENANYQYVILDTDPAIARAAEIIKNSEEYYGLLENVSPD